jgi:hypothetical protein
LSLAWTVRGQTPSVSACQGIASLDLLLAPDQQPGTLEISPIDCPLDRFRYERLPEGAATLELLAKDPGGAIVARGSARVTLTTLAPDAPTPLDLR